MSSEFALRRRLFRMITCEVTEIEGVESLRIYLIANLPKEYKHANADQNVASFLIANRTTILSIPEGVLISEQRRLLLPESADGFSLESVNPSSLAAVVRYLLPFSPGGQPDPSNSLWKTRLKLLPSSGDIASFVRLWRLWNKYQHNEQMNHSIPEIQHDFEAVERAVLLLNGNSASLRKKMSRFTRLMNFIESENDVAVLKECANRFKEIVTDFHRETGKLEKLLGQRNGLRLLLAASQLELQNQ